MRLNNEIHRQAPELGLSLERIRVLRRLASNQDRPCEAIDAIAREYLEAVGRKLARVISRCRMALFPNAKYRHLIADGEGVCKLPALPHAVVAEDALSNIKVQRILFGLYGQWRYNFIQENAWTKFFQTIFDWQV